MDDDTQVRAVEGEPTDELPPNVRVLPGGKDEAARARQAEEKEAKRREKYELIRRRLRTKWEEEGNEGEPPPEEGQTSVIERYALTCMGNAERLRHYYGDRLRFVAGTRSRSGRWLWHDGVRWRWDETRRIKFYACETVKKIMAEAEMARSLEEALALAVWCEKSQGASAINGMISLAEPLLAASAEALQAQRERLVTGAGLVDLRTGALLPPDDKNFDVHWTPVVYDPDARCPKWEAFVDQVMDHDPEMVDYLQRAAGYAATGHSREQVLLFFHGSGGNGKGAFLRLVSKALGSYALSANLDFAQAVRYHGHQTDIHQLRDKRLVLLAELGQGDQLDEARIKALTGGDVLSGRGIAQDFSSFEPTQTYILATNHLPVVKSQDDGTWRRFVVVPWPVRLVENPTDADLAAGALPLQKDFEDGLAEELPGVLRWIVDGAKAWMECGLQPPQKVVEATAAYRHQQDAYRPFMEGCTVRGPRAEVGSTPFYQAYEEFQTLRGEPVDAHRTFTLHLRSHYGLEPKKDSKGRMVFRGIGLRPREEWAQPDGEDTEGTEHTEG